MERPTGKRDTKVWTSVIYEGDTSSVEDDQIPAMVELCKVLLFRKVWNDRFDSAMIHFMAVMGIDETNARLRDGNDYSYMIAGLVYVSRLVAAEALLPSLERENQGEAEFEAFLERRKEFFADGSMSVMAEMLSLLAYGKKIAKTSTPKENCTGPATEQALLSAASNSQCTTSSPWHAPLWMTARTTCGGISCGPAGRKTASCWISIASSMT
ncbi:unnamed protein product [Aureobasidium pullulans]|nr:unnamed protein product [Aureobasidium pullulans]